MRAKLSLLVLALSLVPFAAQASGFHTVEYFDDQVHVTPRVIDRSIEPLVRDHHTDHTQTDPATGTYVLFYQAYRSNMCVLEVKHCAAAQQNAGKSSQDCFQFSRQL